MSKQTYILEIETDYPLIDISQQIALWIKESLEIQVKSESQNATLSVNCNLQDEDE